MQLPEVSDVEFEASLAELRELAKTLGFTVTRTFTQKRSGFDAAAYLGAGRREEIRRFVNAEAVNKTGADDAAQVSPEPIEILFVDHEISPSQARNLENEVGCQVMDRTMVILEIFHRNARSPAARAEVEIARLGYMAPCWREAAKLAGPQGRQRSGVGGRGAGESSTELDKRKIRDRIAELEFGAATALCAATRAAGQIEDIARALSHRLPDGRFRYRVADTDVHGSNPKQQMIA